MLIKVGFEIAFVSPQPAPMVLMLYLHSSRELTTRKPDRLEVTPRLPVAEYYDLYGNRCGRLIATEQILEGECPVFLDGGGATNGVAGDAVLAFVGGQHL